MCTQQPRSKRPGICEREQTCTHLGLAVPAGGGAVAGGWWKGLLYVTSGKEEREMGSVCTVAFLPFEMATHPPYECSRMLPRLLWGVE